MLIEIGKFNVIPVGCRSFSFAFDLVLAAEKATVRQIRLVGKGVDIALHQRAQDGHYRW